MFLYKHFVLSVVKDNLIFFSMSKEFEKYIDSTFETGIWNLDSLV